MAKTTFIIIAKTTVMVGRNTIFISISNTIVREGVKKKMGKSGQADHLG